MPSLGWSVDHLIGHLSRGLHLRRTKLNTVGDRHRPTIEWIPGGHMTFAFSLRRIVRRMREFHAGLKAPATAPFAVLQS